MFLARLIIVVTSPWRKDYIWASVHGTSNMEELTIAVFGINTGTLVEESIKVDEGGTVKY